MPTNAHIDVRAARAGDGSTVLEITRRSVCFLAREHYAPEQIRGWMEGRTARTYEELIAKGRMVIAEREGRAVGFVDCEPGEVTRLFVLPEAAGTGIGKRLLDIGIANARIGAVGPIRVEATINAESFYRRHGFRPVGRSHFSHGLGGPPIEIVLMEL